MANKRNPSERSATQSESAAIPDESAPLSQIESEAQRPDTGVPSTEEVQRIATDYYRKLAEAASRLTEQSRRLYEISQTYAREHPAGMIAGAFVAGLIVGLMTNKD